MCIYIKLESTMSIHDCYKSLKLYENLSTRVIYIHTRLYTKVSVGFL